MPVSLSDAIRRVRARVDEPAYPTLPTSTATAGPFARLYTDTEITDWINDGLRDISRRAEDLITYDTTIAIPAFNANPTQPVPTYNLLNDIIRINRVEFQVAGDSTRIYPLEATTQAYLDNIWTTNQLSTSAYPTFYVTRGMPGGTGRNTFLIQIYPNPAQAGNLNVFYYRLPVRLADPVANPAVYNSPLDVIEGWDDLVVDYAVMQALIKARSPDWQTAQQMYEAKMVSIIDQTRRFNDQPAYLQYDGTMMPWGYDAWGGW